MSLVRKYYNFFISPDKAFAHRLKNVLGFYPSNLDLYHQAFRHKSNQLKDGRSRYNNERLEFLGDSILSTVVADYLFKKYPGKDEGFLTKMRAKIVKRKTLNHIGDLMGLDMILAEQNSNTRLSRSMMGNALEAVVGAVYMERGYRKTKNFVISKMLRAYLDIHELEQLDDNFKSKLLEWCQKNGNEISYEVVDRFKIDKRDRFKVAVLVNGDHIAYAEDFNKKSAEQFASMLALQKLDGQSVPE